MKNNSVFLKIKDGFCNFYKKDKKNFIIIIICFAIIIGLFVSTFFTNNKKNIEKTTLLNKTSITDYADKIESKLIGIIEKLDSVTSVDVFVMVEATPTINYLTETKETTVTNEKGSTSEITTTVVFEKNGSIQTPVVVTTIMPKITGVLIVTNEINASTKILIKNSISVVLNIDESCISLLQER